jgi:hypothetical protein
MLLRHEKGEETVGKPSLTVAATLQWGKEPRQTGSPAVDSDIFLHGLRMSKRSLDVDARNYIGEGSMYSRANVRANSNDPSVTIQQK